MKKLVYIGAALALTASSVALADVTYHVSVQGKHASYPGPAVSVLNVYSDDAVKVDSSQCHGGNTCDITLKSGNYGRVAVTIGSSDWQSYCQVFVSFNQMSEDDFYQSPNCVGVFAGGKTPTFTNRGGLFGSGEYDLVLYNNTK